MPDAESPMATRLEAWKNPKTKMWQVDRITYVSMGKDVDALIKKETIIRPGLCFFDALHFCSTFEYTEEAMGKQEITLMRGHSLIVGNCSENIIHWRQVAKDSGQAIDAEGIVQPCAYGRILVDGTFTEKEIFTATQSSSPTSTDSSRVSVGIADQMLTQVLSRGAPQIAQSDLLTNVKNRMAEVAKYDEVIEAGASIISTFNKIAGNGFIGAYNSRERGREYKDGKLVKNILTEGQKNKIKAVCSFGLLPLTRYLDSNLDFFPDSVLENVCYDFNKVASKLANEDDKKLCAEFTKNVMFAFYMSRALSLYNNRDKEGVDTGIKDVEKAGKIMSLSDIDLERLKAEYIDGRLEYRDFQRIPRLGWDEYGREDSRRESENNPITPLSNHLRQRRDEIKNSRALG